MDTLGSVIRNILVKYKLVDQIAEYDIVSNYKSLFPGYISDNSKPLRLDENLLYIKVQNSVLRNELKFREIEITSKINGFLGKKQVKKIHFI